MTLCSIPLIVILLVGSGPSLQAQFRDSLGGRWNNPVSASIGTSLAWRAVIEAPRRPASPPAPEPKGPAPTLTFPAAQPSTVPDALAAGLGEDPGHRKELGAAFREWLQAFEQDALADKEPRSVARAAAFFIVASHMTATGKTPKEAHIEAFQKALAANLLHHGPFQAMGPRQRQDLYETLVILAYLPLVGVRDAQERQQPARVALFRDFARQGLQTLLGTTPERMAFTETGLTFR